MFRPAGPLLLAGVVLGGLGVAAPFARAGLYSPDESTPFKVGPSGAAEELSFGSQFDGLFPLRFTALANAADDNPARPDNPDRRAVLARIAARKAAPGPAKPADLAALAADLLRVGRPDEALNLLAPRSRDRVPDFRVLANLAHVHARREEWGEAIRVHQAAVLDADMPDDLAGTTPDQRKWLKRVERVYYAKWLRAHRDRAAAPAAVDREDVFPLFDATFVNDLGKYEPGKLSAVERAKLPPDAIAVVQQLLLWAPWDTGLYWLLGELYAAAGRLREADTIFNQCAFGRQYTNRAIFMAHRSAVREAVTKLPPEVTVEAALADTPPLPTTDPDANLPSRGKVIAGAAVFALVAVVFLGLQIRSVVRRWRR
ncbi:tetratricopeptide repeat protein [Fimbriiglobus ruber]|uniref:Tetratricopeptide repeat protein n=1 Tax=Fimbriiglobus ruber TaxID=1908690 RepID=A0A225DQF3_9BACT|nr:hypothetical protein [Fimbriiglobus ruber]OWK41844.1 hypothetical protein FRUB_03922 [Fimbriiglobus ruber]